MVDDTRLQTVCDVQAIKQLKAAYSHTRENHEWAELVSLFTEDAVIAFPDRTLDGREEIRTFAFDVWSEDFDNEHSMHTALMPRIQVDSDRATGQWFLCVFYSVRDGPEGWALGTYEDRYHRVDGEWKFSRIEATVDYDTARSGRF